MPLQASDVTPAEIVKLPYRPCVGLMVVNSEGKVFAAQRIDSPSPAWQMPQGGVDEGEAPHEAALRELEEETGLTADKVSILGETPEWLPYDLPHDLVPKLWKGRFRGQKQKYFLMRFHGTDSDINIETAEPEFSRWTWMDIDALLDSIVPFKKDSYTKVIAQFRPIILADA